MPVDGILEALCQEIVASSIEVCGQNVCEAATLSIGILPNLGFAMTCPIGEFDCGGMIWT